MLISQCLCIFFQLGEEAGCFWLSRLIECKVKMGYFEQKISNSHDLLDLFWWPHMLSHHCLYWSLSLLMSEKTVNLKKKHTCKHINTEAWQQAQHTVAVAFRVALRFSRATSIAFSACSIASWEEFRASLVLVMASLTPSAWVLHTHRPQSYKLL